MEKILFFGGEGGLGERYKKESRRPTPMSLKGAQSKSHAYAAIQPHLADESKSDVNYIQKPISVNYDFFLLFINK